VSHDYGRYLGPTKKDKQMSPAKNPIAAPLTVYFVRHGQTEWNAQKRLIGNKDLPLTDLGRRQAADAGTCLGWLNGRVSALDFIAGPLLRTRQTMEILRAELGLDVGSYRQDERLKEVDYGQWEGRTWAQIGDSDPSNFQRREADPYGFVHPGGESYARLGDRVRAFLETLTKDACIVSHGGVCRTVLVLAAGMAPDAAARLAIPQDRILMLRGGRFAWLQAKMDLTDQ
jgi:probable phosphoglycerate mutase